MSAKTDRLEAIKMLIGSRELSCQEEVLSALRREGFTTTQATLSRDMKQLNIAKAANKRGKYVYALPNESVYRRPMRFSSPATTFDEPVSISFSGNICVVKTRPGRAGAIAYDIDNSDADGVVGTIAGDDTIFIVMKEGVDTALVEQHLRAIVPGLG